LLIYTGDEKIDKSLQYIIVWRLIIP